MESSLYILPILILLIFAFALLRKFNAYDAFVSGAKEGLSLFVTLFPSLLAMMFAVSLLRESGLKKEEALALIDRFWDQHAERSNE